MLLWCNVKALINAVPLVPNDSNHSKWKLWARLLGDVLPYLCAHGLQLTFVLRMSFLDPSLDLLSGTWGRWAEPTQWVGRFFWCVSVSHLNVRKCKFATYWKSLENCCFCHSSRGGFTFERKQGCPSWTGVCKWRLPGLRMDWDAKSVHFCMQFCRLEESVSRRRTCPCDMYITPCLCASICVLPVCCKLFCLHFMQILFALIPPLRLVHRWIMFWKLELGIFPAFDIKNTKASKRLLDSLTTWMSSALRQDPDLLRRLIPTYPIGCKRITPSDTYLQVSFWSKQYHRGGAYFNILRYHFPLFAPTEYVILSLRLGSFTELVNCQSLSAFSHTGCSDKGVGDMPRYSLTARLCQAVPGCLITCIYISPIPQLACTIFLQKSCSPAPVANQITPQCLFPQHAVSVKGLKVCLAFESLLNLPRSIQGTFHRSTNHFSSSLLGPLCVPQAFNEMGEKMSPYTAG